MDEKLYPSALKKLMVMAAIASSFYGMAPQMQILSKALSDIIVNTELLNWVESVMLLGQGEIDQARWKLQHSSLKEARELLKLLN